jgi:hypothetical protein
MAIEPLSAQTAGGPPPNCCSPRARTSRPSRPSTRSPVADAERYVVMLSGDRAKALQILRKAGMPAADVA